MIKRKYKTIWDHIIYKDTTGTGCWYTDLVFGTRDRPQIRYKGVKVTAARLMYKLTHPEDIEFQLIVDHRNFATTKLVCHSCDNPECMNPDHMFLGTNLQNQREAWRKNRKPKYAKYRSPRSKIRKHHVELILKLYAEGKTQKEIGAMVGCHHSNISLILKYEKANNQTN